MWTRQQMIACLDLIFTHGVRHIFTPVMTEYNFDETTAGYREQLVAWIDWGIAGPDALADYHRRGWQARLIGAEFIPELAATAQRLQEQTAHNEQGPCVWYMALPSPEASWEQVLRLAGAKGLPSRQALIREIYGQDVPLATLYLGSGKPQVFPSIVPPLLMGRVDCYWRQHLGYDLDAATLPRHPLRLRLSAQHVAGRQDRPGRAGAAFPRSLGEPAGDRRRRAPGPVLVPGGHRRRAGRGRR